MRRFTFLVVGLLFSCSALANGVHWTVTTPENYTVVSREDTGDQRVHVLDGGSVIENYNFDAEDELVVVKDPSVTAPKTKVCNDSGDTITVEFYSCSEGGCGCSVHTNATLVEIDPGECHEDTQTDCSIRW